MLCLDEKTGEVIWIYSYECTYQVSYAAGPRTTPVVTGGKVYTLGTMGDLVCLNAARRQARLVQELRDGVQNQDAALGLSGHPLVDGNRLICLVGGEGSVAVAFDKDTGKELWKNLSAKETRLRAADDLHLQRQTPS